MTAGPTRSLVVVDFDGTLAPIVDDPATSRPAVGAIEALQALVRNGFQIAVITGRGAETVIELGSLDGVPGIEVLGQYGAERYRSGVLEATQPRAGIAAVRAALPGVLADADGAVWVEDKRLSLVVHTRRCADPRAQEVMLTPSLIALAETNGLQANAGRHVIEIRPPGIDKGAALRRLVADHRPAAVLYAGDDVGDLPAFAAIAAIRAEGIPGIAVCSASAEAAAVAVAADLVVDGPDAVVDLLGALAAATTTPRSQGVDQ